jgi:hypothetical protein
LNLWFDKAGYNEAYDQYVQVVEYYIGKRLKMNFLMIFNFFSIHSFPIQLFASHITADITQKQDEDVMWQNNGSKNSSSTPPFVFDFRLCQKFSIFNCYSILSLIPNFESNCPWIECHQSSFYHMSLNRQSSSTNIEWKNDSIKKDKWFNRKLIKSSLNENKSNRIVTKCRNLSQILMNPTKNPTVNERKLTR